MNHRQNRVVGESGTERGGGRLISSPERGNQKNDAPGDHGDADQREENGRGPDEADSRFRRSHGILTKVREFTTGVSLETG